MSDDRSTFEVTRARLEDIVTHVRRKDVSLEQSLDLLEEAVRLVNQCNDLIDQTSFRPAAVEPEVGEGETATEVASEPDAAPAASDGEAAADVALTTDAVLDGAGEPGEAEAVAAESDESAADVSAAESDEDAADATDEPEGVTFEVIDTFVELSEIEFVIEDDERE